MHGWKVIPARQLSAEHIGRLVRTRTWDNNTEIATVQTGELRQIGCNSAEVWLNIGIGAAIEVRMGLDQPVTIDPPASYADVIELARQDGQV